MQGRALSCRRASLPLCDESSLNTHGLVYGVPRVYDVIVRYGSRSTRLPVSRARSPCFGRKGTKQRNRPKLVRSLDTRCCLVALSVLGGRKRGRKDPDDGAGEGEGEGLPQVKGISRDRKYFPLSPRRFRGKESARSTPRPRTERRHGQHQQQSHQPAPRNRRWRARRYAHHQQQRRRHQS